MMDSWTYRMVCGLVVLFTLASNLPETSANYLQLRASVDFSYNLGNAFLDLIRGSKEFEASPEMYNNFPTTFNMTDLYIRFKPMMRHYVSYLVLYCIGLLFVIIMPIVGLLFCCCRCCGHCGGGIKTSDSRHAGCKRVFFTICLVIITTIKLAGVVLAFINNQLMHEAVANKDVKMNAIRQINNSFIIFNESSVQMHSAIDNLTSVPISPKVDRIVILSNVEFNKIQKIVNDKSFENIGNWIDPSLKQIRTDTVKFESQQTQIQNFMAKFQDVKDILNPNEVSSVYNVLKTELKKCHQSKQSECDRLYAIVVDQLMVQNDYHQGDFKDAKNIMTKITNKKEAIDKLSSIPNFLFNISSDLQKALRPKITAINDKVMDSEKMEEVQKSLKDFVGIMDKQVTNLTDKYHKMLPSQQSFIKYDTFRMYGYIGVCCVMLLIILFYYLGLCFGMCGERPFEDASLCNRGVGANLLMTGVGFAFFFSWLLMMLTMCFFMIGGPIQTELCRYATGHIKGGERILDDYFRKSIEVANKMGMPNEFAGNTCFESVLDKCSRYSLVQSFNLTAKYIDEVAFNDNFIKPFITEVKSDRNTLTAPLSPSFTSEKSTIESLKNDPDMINMNLDAVREKTSKTITKIGDFNTFYADLKKLNSDPLKESITKLEAVKTAADLQSEIQNLLLSLKNFKSSLEPVSTGITQLEAALTDKTTYVDDAIKNLEKGMTDDVIAVARPFFDSVGCTQLNLAGRTLINAGCVTYLYPFNGFWYGLGICLVLFIPGIIFAVKLAGLYRRTDKYCSDYDEPDYQSYQGFYINQSDHIPLERSKNKGGGKEKGNRDPNRQPNQRYQQLPVYPYDAYE